MRLSSANLWYLFFVRSLGKINYNNEHYVVLSRVLTSDLISGRPDVRLIKADGANVTQELNSHKSNIVAAAVEVVDEATAVVAIVVCAADIAKGAAPLEDVVDFVANVAAVGAIVAASEIAHTDVTMASTVVFVAVVAAVVAVVAVVVVVVAAAAAVADGHALRHFSFSEIFFLISLSL